MAQQDPIVPGAAAGGGDDDAYMRSQIDYWKNRKATNPDQVGQKYEAYQYATDHGIRGAAFLSQDELAMVGGKDSVNWAQLGSGSALGTLGTIAAGISGNIPGTIVGAGATAASVAAEQQAGNAGNGFGQNQDKPASSYILPSRSTPTMPGGSGGSGGSGGGLSDPQMPAGYGTSSSMPNYAPQTGYVPPQTYGQPPLDPNDPANGLWGSMIPAGGVQGTGSYAPVAPVAVQNNPNGFSGFTPQQLQQMGQAPQPAAAGPYQTPASAPGQPPNVPSSGDPYLDAILAQQGKTATQNRVAVTSLYGDPVMRQGVTNQKINQALGANLAQEQENIGGYIAKSNQLQTDYGNELGAATAYDAQNTQSYQQKLASYSQLQASPYWGDAVSNPDDVARENQSYSQLSGIAGGSLNYTADQASYQTAALAQAQLYQAAMERAQSNGTDVDAEYAALQQLQQNAGGALDVVNGANAPEAYQAQLSALSQMGDLTHPERTAQEEFLYEQQRAKEEQDQRSSRAAVMSNLRARGMSGSGMELTDQLGADQITSQNRLLGDLGTQATAVARAQAALGQFGQLGTAMVGQGNQVALANQGVRAGSAQAQGALSSDIRGQSDLMSRFNADAFNQNQQFNANAANQNSMYNAGLRESNNEFNANAYNQNSQFNANANNVAYANNQQTQLSGANNAASLASSMRGQSDAIAVANKQQQGISSMHQDNYAAQQQNDAVARDTSSYNAGTDFTTRYTDNAGKLNTTGVLTNNNNMGALNQGTQAVIDYQNGVGTRGQQDVTNGLGLANALTGPAVSPSYNDILSTMSGARVAGALNPKINF